MTASHDSVLIVDGTFLQGPELRGHFDLAIFLETSVSISEHRGVVRDAERLGGREEAHRLYCERYRPAFNFYEEACRPSLIADVIVNNDDLSHPRVVVRAEGRLGNQRHAVPRTI